MPGVAAESPHGRELALEWIESDQEAVAAAGWSTLSLLVAITDDAELDLKELKRLLHRVQKSVHAQPNDVRYAMNGFVISVGCYVAELTDLALKTAAAIGEAYRLLSDGSRSRSMITLPVVASRHVSSPKLPWVK